MRSFEWSIEEVISAHPDLYLEHCSVMAIALMKQQTSSPCEFILECHGFSVPELGQDDQCRVRVFWNPATEAAASRVLLSEQRKPIVERGAVALAALTLSHLVADSRMQVTNQGDRVDYWLPKQRLALEISGTEQVREISRRVRTKSIQLLANPRGLDGFLCVCCFGKDQNRIRWSFHVQER